MQTLIFILTTLVCWGLACRRLYEAAAGVPLYRIARRLPAPLAAEIDASLRDQSRTSGSPELAQAFQHLSFEVMCGTACFLLEVAILPLLWLLWQGPWAWLALAVLLKDLGQLGVDFEALRRKQGGEGMMAFIRRLPWWVRAADRLSAAVSALALLAFVYHAWTLGA